MKCLTVPPLVLGLLIALTASAQPRILQGPVVDAVTYTTARVTWITDAPSSTEIKFGITTAYDRFTTGIENQTTHSWYLSGLAPGTTYHFQVCSKTGITESCSEDQVVTTLSRSGNTPFPPEPPQKFVDVSMPAGSYGDPFIINSDCFNLRQVLSDIANLSGDLNHEVLLSPGTACRGQFVFPARPNHTGWVVVRSTESGALPEGQRVAADATSKMAVFITDAAPAAFNVIANIGTSCIPDTLFWAITTPGMALFVCNDNAGGLSPTQSITDASWTGTDAVVLTVPGHRYRTGDVIRVTGTNVGVDNTYWRITVLDDDRFALDGSRGRGTFSGAATVARNEAWKQVPHTSGGTLPESCNPNDFFFQTNVTPTTEAVYWCTLPNQWTNIRMINTTVGENFSALQFAAKAAKYRFIGIEVTHIPMPSPPPQGWSARSYRQGNIGSLITTRETNSFIIFDRCDIHGLDYPGRLSIGVNLDGSDVAIINSRIHKVNRWTERPDGVNLESFAINVLFGPGPGKIDNNLLEAIGITIFFPDAGLDAYHRTPAADYEIVRNYFSHPQKYLKGSPMNDTDKCYMNRHHFELKRGRRFLVEGNVFDENWADVNQGAFLMFTPRPGTVPAPKTITGIQDGVLTVTPAAPAYQAGILVSVTGTNGFDGIWEVESLPASNQVKLTGVPPGRADAGGTAVAVASDIQISDIDIRNNIFRYGPNLLWITGHQDNAGGILNTKTTQRIRLENNLVYGMDANLASPSSSFRNGRPGILAFAARGMEDLIIRNNTVADFKGATPTLLFMDSTRAGAHGGLDVAENIFIGPQAVMAQISGSAFGDRALDQQWTAAPLPSWKFERNVFCCSNPGMMQVRNRMNAPNLWVDNPSDVRLANPATGDFRLAPDSPFKDGKFCLPGFADCWTTGVDPGVNLDLLLSRLSPDNPSVLP